MSGSFAEADCRAWARAYRERGTVPFGGRRHAVVADMRGMKTVHPSLAGILGDEIAHARRNGVVLCAHLSDDVVQRLQIARVARSHSAMDDVTVDVHSLDEAYRIIDQYVRYLDDPRFPTSIRGALPER